MEKDNKSFLIVLSRKNILKILFFSMFFLPSLIFAAAMQSGSYQIQTDSINIGGTDQATSTSYTLDDTVGEVATGGSNSANYYMKAGYRQMQEVYIALSSPTDVSLGIVSGITNSSALGSATWNVTTDNNAGYSLDINSSTNPALKSATSSFSNYTPSGTNPDYSFSIASNSSAFGFSPEGLDISTKYKDNGSTCNSGSGDTVDKCWDGLATTPKIISTKTSSNHPSGTNTTVKFRADNGSSHIQESGYYSAYITVTAVTL